MMKIVFNTLRPSSPASIFYRAGLSLMTEISFDDREHFDLYAVALFMGFPDDFNLIKKAKQQNPSIKIGIIDPRSDEITEISDYIDFFILDSLEMIDFFCKFQKPIFQYFEYPLFEPQKKIHEQKSKIVIGYHGNKVHLMAMWEGLSPALQRLAADMAPGVSLVFKPIYNIKQLGLWDVGVPSHIEIDHTQWDEKTFQIELSSCDVGVVPAFLPLSRGDAELRSTLAYRKVFLHSAEDYLFRIKMPTNLGRIIVFARLGVPVISDMFPSACQYIEHGKDGFLAANSEAWYVYLKKLVSNYSLRQQFSDSLYEKIHNLCDYRIQNEKLKSFLSDLLLEKKAADSPPVFIYKTRYSQIYLLRSYVALRLKQAFLRGKNIFNLGG